MVAVTTAPPPTLKRSLSLLMVVFYGIGTIIGAGIYVLIGKVAGAAGIHTPVAFLLAAGVALFSALSYAELSARFPKAAGEAVYVFQGTRLRTLATVVGLASIAIGIVSTATLMRGFVGYFQTYVDANDIATIIIVAVIVGGIVAWGVTESVGLAALMTVAEIAGLLVIIWVARSGFIADTDVWLNMATPASASAWQGVVLGAFLAFYAFIGFEDIVNLAEEVRAPERNLPRGILIAWGSTTLLYVTVATLAVMVMPPAKLAGSEAPLAALYTHVTGAGPFVITLISLMSIINGALIQVYKTSRILYGMASRGWMPRRLATINARRRTPLLATALVTFAVIVFAALVPLVSLARLTSTFTLLVFALVNLSLLLIKRRGMKRVAAGIDVPRFVPAVGLVSSLALLIAEFIVSG